MRFPTAEELVNHSEEMEKFINDVVDSKEDNAMMILVGCIATSLKDIAVALTAQNILMSANYEDVVEKEVQQRGELRAAEIVEESQKRNILGRRGPPPVKKTS